MRLLCICISLFVFSFSSLYAQEIHQDLKEIVTADIVAILSEEEREIEGTNTSTHVQQVKAIITSGSLKGKTVIFENEIVVLEVEDTVYLHYLKTINGDEYYLFKDFKRHTQLIILSVFFVALLVFFAKMQGVRALVSLGASVVAILFVLVPLMLNGYNPILVSLGAATVILAFVLFVTHGITAQSTIAFLGTVSAICITALVAWASVSSMKLTGFGNDASVALNFATDGTLDFGGLLLGSIIIGILGMLDDVSITQVSVVLQLKRANKTLQATELYKRAIVVGKDHLGSLVNTLALAYVGVSLPLVLLLAHADAAIGLSLNQEVVAAELVRIIVGSVGLILAVPITTLIAALYFGKHEITPEIDEHHDGFSHDGHVH